MATARARLRHKARCKPEPDHCRKDRAKSGPEVGANPGLAEDAPGSPEHMQRPIEATAQQDTWSTAVRFNSAKSIVAVLPPIPVSACYSLRYVHGWTASGAIMNMKPRRAPGLLPAKRIGTAT